MYWRYQLTEESNRRTVQSKRGKGDRISIVLLEVMALVTTAYLMVVMKGDRPEKEGAMLLMRGDISSAVQWEIKCKGRRREEVRMGALMRMLGASETQGRWCSQAKRETTDLQTKKLGGRQRKSKGPWPKRAPKLFGRYKSWGRRSSGCGRRFCERIHLWTACEVD